MFEFSDHGGYKRDIKFLAYLLNGLHSLSALFELMSLLEGKSTVYKLSVQRPLRQHL